jgi:hypothetical protein
MLPPGFPDKDAVINDVIIALLEVYACQARSTHHRRHFKLCKIRLLLGGTASPLDPFPERLPKMHWKRYERMKQRAMAGS